MHISLPLSPRHAPRPAEAPEFQPAAAWRDFYPTVLLVDDDPGVRTALTRVLQNDGINVVTAANGDDATWSIEVYEPNLVITDLCMAQTNGWQLLTREKRLRPRMPIFVISALAARAASGASEAADAFFQKPLDLDALLAAIHRCLGPANPAQPPS